MWRDADWPIASCSYELQLGVHVTDAAAFPDLRRSDAHAAGRRAKTAGPEEFAAAAAAAQIRSAQSGDSRLDAATVIIASAGGEPMSNSKGAAPSMPKIEGLSSHSRVGAA